MKQFDIQVSKAPPKVAKNKTNNKQQQNQLKTKQKITRYFKDGFDSEQSCHIKTIDKKKE